VHGVDDHMSLLAHEARARVGKYSTPAALMGPPE